MVVRRCHHGWHHATESMLLPYYQTCAHPGQPLAKALSPSMQCMAGNGDVAGRMSGPTTRARARGYARLSRRAPTKIASRQTLE